MKPTAHLMRILALVADGLTDEQIGQELRITAGTVRGCVQRICRVYGATGRAHAVAVAMRKGHIR